MQYEISNRMSDVHGSAIRELFKLGADPNMISFGGGNPSAETFPVPEIADIIADVMKNAPVSVLQYGLSEGYTPLRDHLRAKGYDLTYEESPGDHQWKYWDEKIQTVLSWLPISKPAKN